MSTISKLSSPRSVSEPRFAKPVPVRGAHVAVSVSTTLFAQALPLAQASQLTAASHSELVVGHPPVVAPQFTILTWAKFVAALASPKNSVPAWGVTAKTAAAPVSMT